MTHQGDWEPLRYENEGLSAASLGGWGAEQNIWTSLSHLKLKVTNSRWWDACQRWKKPCITERHTHFYKSKIWWVINSKMKKQKLWKWFFFFTLCYQSRWWCHCPTEPLAEESLSLEDEACWKERGREAHSNVLQLPHLTLKRVERSPKISGVLMNHLIERKCSSLLNIATNWQGFHTNKDAVGVIDLIITI